MRVDNSRVQSDDVCWRDRIFLLRYWLSDNHPYSGGSVSPTKRPTPERRAGKGHICSLAQVAAQALTQGDTSRKSLAAYDRLYHGPFQRGLDAEFRIINGLAGMSEAELNRLCETLSKINLAPFFFGEWRPLLSETARWLALAWPLILRDGRLLLLLSSRDSGLVAHVAVGGRSAKIEPCGSPEGEHGREGQRGRPCGGR